MIQVSPDHHDQEKRAERREKREERREKREERGEKRYERRKKKEEIRPDGWKEEVGPDGSRWARGGGLSATRWGLWRRDVRAEGRGKRADKRRKSEERRERR